ncbi:MAG: 8-oxoguanine DNA glycosylase [Lachnospiraceae bacterium]|nr:8-oxoguanine DNA glycosylase [Lachnospiraceae bacterium]
MTVDFNDDFDAEKIADSGQCFRWEALDENTYRIPFGRERLYLTKTGEDKYELDCSESEYDSVWSGYFDTELSYRKIRAAAGDDDHFMKAACEDQKGIRILKQDPWETSISFIISQNRNIPAIKKSIELICEACGTECTDKRGEKFYAFPDPEQIASLSEEKLGECKLGYRLSYIRRFAEDVASGTTDLDKLVRLNEEDAFKELTSIYGIGPKVANCINLFGLHHLNAFPIDTWIKKILAAEYAEGYPYEKYSPYNGIFQQYMFAYYRKINA